jgi:hypothetical protein
MIVAQKPGMDFFAVIHTYGSFRISCVFGRMEVWIACGFEI